MRTFKAKHNKGYYKSTDAWIDAVYRNNRAVIDANLNLAGRSPRATFKQIIKEYISEGVKPTVAMQTLARSTVFTPAQERIKTNLWTGLKGDKDAYKKFRELTKDKGKYTTFDPSKLVWDRASNVYIYNSFIKIGFQNSPYGIEVNKL